MRIKFFILLLAAGMGIASCSSSRETTTGADSAMTDGVDTTGTGGTTTPDTTSTRDTTRTGDTTGTTAPPKR